MREIEEVFKTLNVSFGDTLPVEIDSDLCRPNSKEIIVGHKGRKEPRSAQKECPRLDSEGRRFVFYGTPRECAQDTGEDGEEGTDDGDDCTQGEHVCEMTLAFEINPDGCELLTMDIDVNNAMGDY